MFPDLSGLLGRPPEPLAVLVLQAALSPSGNAVDVEDATQVLAALLDRLDCQSRPSWSLFIQSRSSTIRTEASASNRLQIR